MPKILIPLIEAFYTKIENLPKFLQDQKFNLKAVEQALDSETGKLFNEIYPKFKQEQEAKIKENVDSKNLEEVLTQFNKKIEESLKNPLLVYELI